jgi:hypothetical protein
MHMLDQSHQCDVQVELYSPALLSAGSHCATHTSHMNIFSQVLYMVS